MHTSMLPFAARCIAVVPLFSAFVSAKHQRRAVNSKACRIEMLGEGSTLDQQL